MADPETVAVMREIIEAVEKHLIPFEVVRGTEAEPEAVRFEGELKGYKVFGEAFPDACYVSIRGVIDSRIDESDIEAFRAKRRLFCGGVRTLVKKVCGIEPEKVSIRLWRRNNETRIRIDMWFSEPRLIPCIIDKLPEILMSVASLLSIYHEFVSSFYAGRSRLRI